MGLYRRRKSQSYSPTFRHDPSKDRVLRQIPLNAEGEQEEGWKLARSTVVAPFYLRSDDTQMEHQLPKVKEVLESLDELTCSQHWDKSLNVSGNMRKILASLGDMLEPSACDTSGGCSSSCNSPFDHPLCYRRHITITGVKKSISHTEEREACMYLSASKLAEGRGGMHQMEAGSYVLVNLGSFKGAAITECAHRIVLWAMHGPDIPALASAGWSTKGPHCLHTCGHKDCLNPSHLVWGSAQNNKFNKEWVYLALLQKQGRI